jgi:site-specific DNA recombinase
VFPAEQAGIVTLLVERVDIGTNELNFWLRMDRIP